ncbi:hypothetical protein F1645_10815 [Novacetimonas hansenii]
MKLFSKSFRRRSLFEKSRHPKTFLVFLSMPCFQTLSQGTFVVPRQCVILKRFLDCFWHGVTRITLCVAQICCAI